MLELKFKGKPEESKVQNTCCPGPHNAVPAWVIGNVTSPAGPIRRVSTSLSRTDYWEHIKCRTTSFRNDYTVDAGLYAVGDPDNNSDVFVSANYKYSFDLLRRELKGLNAWLLVLDTKGINVWCAAGKGSFGNDELIKRISSVHLDKVVVHRQVVVPQLGAPGVSAFVVKRTTGFQVLYGPVYAKDIPAYIHAGYKATAGMRKVNFSFPDRLILTPMEINPAMKKYLLYALLIFFLFGLAPTGILFKDALLGGLPFILLGFISVLAGALVTPALLPYIPFRSFAAKGWIVGLFSVFLSTKLLPLLNHKNSWLIIITYLFFPAASSYIALQFTGSTTFTGMSGVKKELRIAIPAYIFVSALSVLLLIIFKLTMWGVI